MRSERMWGSQCSVSGRRSLCHRHRGAERLLVWWSTGTAGWFRQYLDTKHRSLPRPTLAMIAQLQLPSSTGSLVEHENSRTTFVSFQVHSTVLRQVHRSEPHEPQEQSGHPQWFLRSPRSSLSFVNWCFPSSLRTATVTCNFERVFELWVSRTGEKNHTSKSCSFVAFVESNCKLKRSSWGILLNTEKGQTWLQQCQLALWTFTWQGRTPIRLSRASSHDVTMTTCIRAIVQTVTVYIGIFQIQTAPTKMVKPELFKLYIGFFFKIFLYVSLVDLSQLVENKKGKKRQFMYR